MPDQSTDPQIAPQGAETGRGFLLQTVVLAGVIAITVIITLWVSRDAERSGVEILVPLPAPITFQVSGEVVRPGVYSLDGEPRINDVVDAAGGFTATADTNRINLAAQVRDGSKIVIPSLLAADNSTSGSTVEQNDNEASLSGNTPANTSPPNTTGLMDLNIATKDQLIALPGIGEVRADSIIEWRSNNPINLTSDLLAINGIGPSTVNSIRDLVTQP